MSGELAHGCFLVIDKVEAVVGAQLIEQSLPTPEIRALNPDIGKILSANYCTIEKTKIKKKEAWNSPSLRNVCGRVAQSVELLSKVPVWCYSTDVGSNPGRGIGVRNNFRRKKKTSHAICEYCGIKSELLGRNKIFKKSHRLSYGRHHCITVTSQLRHSCPINC